MYLSCLGPCPTGPWAYERVVQCCRADSVLGCLPSHRDSDVSLVTAAVVRQETRQCWCGWCRELWFAVLTLGSNMAEGVRGMGRRPGSCGASWKLDVES